MLWQTTGSREGYYADDFLMVTHVALGTGMVKKMAAFEDHACKM
jgi:hypothetical protein